ncbi:MAG: hypothetical protein GY827_11815 [Cytophagales bacterium]|nr:hypothetical protein [Cytophagales bacterium]
MNNIDNYDLFLRHSQKKLSGKELADFCERLENDSAFRNEFEEYEFSRQFFVQQELFEVKDILNELETSNPPSGNNKFWLGGSIVSLLILTGIGTYFITQDEKEPITIVENVTPHNETSTEGIHKNKNTVEEADNTVTTQPTPTHNSEPSARKTKETVKVKDTATHTVKLAQDNPIDSVTNSKAPKQREIVTANTTVNTQNDLAPTLDTNIPCPSIQLSVNTTNSCGDDATGEIKISSIQGGKEPYVYLLNQEEQSSNAFTDLEVGTYTILVKDVNGCETSQNVRITEKTCIDDHYEFTYSYQDSWVIPVSKNGKFSLYSRQGKQVVTLNLEEDVEIEWNGLDRNGNQLPTGLYPFIIELEGERLTGSISIYP